MSDSKKPKGVYVIIENEKLEKSFWKRVGTAFTNRDDSVNIILDALPLNGKLQVRELTEREDGREREAA